MNKISLLSALTFIITLSSCTGKKEAGLVAYWNFNQIENNQIEDGSGNDLHAVNHGCRITEGKYGNALYCNGSYLEVAYKTLLDSFKTGMTVCVCVNRDTSSIWNCIITREPEITGRSILILAFTRIIPCFRLIPMVAILLKRIIRQIPVNTWVLLAGTYDNKTYKLFISGLEVASGTKEMPFRFTDQNPIIIAGNTNDQGKIYHDFFYGKIDEMKIFNSALTAGEIMTEFRHLP